MRIYENSPFRSARNATRALLLCWAVVAVCAATPGLAANLPGLTVIGVAADGTETPVTEYRWLVEEDRMYHVAFDGSGNPIVDPANPAFDQHYDNTLAVSFHKSYMPVVAKGCVGFADLIGTPSEIPCTEVPLADPNMAATNHYYVSVVPRSGYTIGGASFKDGDANITVYVNEHPIETAQISILIFEDNFPINNAPDLPGEDPTLPGNTDMSGFQIILEDAGGRYGASAGVQSQDAFGNPLGTQYDALGNVIGYEPLVTDSTGRLLIKNLAPGKYGIQAVPPPNSGWQQTSTIEGTKVIDAWVKAGEPPFFAEFGPVGFHVFIGFVKEFSDPAVVGAGGATITGTVVNQHLSRPPDYAFYNGSCFGHTTPWVGLNDLSVGIGKGVYAAPTDGNCGFSIPNVPDGNYQLVMWDNNLDLIFAFKGISIVNGQCNTPTGCTLGEVPVFQWFHRQEHRVYDDVNANGVWDADEGPSAIDVGFNLRWRDGTVYQGNVSDPAGAFTFDQVFPFFSWLVAEVDFARFEATGLTVVVDDGGAIPAWEYVPAPLDDDDATFGRTIAPQDHLNPPDPECVDPAVCEENGTYRTEHGVVLTHGFQGFIGQTNAYLWGKRHYPDNSNGGISGIVFYAVTRAENDPQYAAAEVWEPGIPGVTVNLYDSTGATLLNSTTTDSWDDSIPTGCKYGSDGAPFMFDPDGTGPLGPYPTDCYDGLRVFNQSRPAVFDGGYAFDSICEDAGGMLPDGTCTTMSAVIPAGDYVVEVIPPAGYELLKEEDKNVDFGDEYQPAPALLPPACVGADHLIPPYLNLFPDEQIQSPFAWSDTNNDGIDDLYTPTYRPLCDRKLVTVSQGFNAAADFFLFTEVPIAAHGFGFILDDTTSEFNPNSPQFGEKYAPPFVPVTVRDFTGRVISKTMSDQFGRYNFLAPSTITTNLPAPSGMSPNMLTTCMNDPGDDPNNPDPFWSQQYSTFCYTFQYMPGTTTYLDTPVVPVAAFTGPDQYPLDCEYPDGTPRIHSVDVQTNGVGGGPYIPLNNQNAVELPQLITINSLGATQVQNPDYCNPVAGACAAGSDTIHQFIVRDFGFGAAPGTVTLGSLGAITVQSWSDATIVAEIPAGTVVPQIGARQLTVTRANGQATKAGVSVQMGLRQGSNAVVVGPPTGGPLDSTLQDAINLAGANDLLLVRPGVYNEMVIMWKPLQLQGWGEGSTTINAVNAPADKLDIWRGLVDGLIAGGDVDLLPGQEVGGGAPEPLTLFTEEGAGILVLAAAGGNNNWERDRNMNARIDGFTIKGASTGGGIVVNGYADYLDISNNRIAGNNGSFGGGIRVGHPELIAEQPAGIVYTDGDNDHVDVHHNQVVFNGALGGAGGGISMCTGSDGYKVTLNWVCGNFSTRDGGGIGHIGVSDGTWVLGPGNGNSRQWLLTDVPTIADNTIIFNENFFQGATVSGGGIYIGGPQPLTIGGLTPGAGNIRVNRNLIQGNSAGAGDGGGIRLAGINGEEVAANPTNAWPRNGNQGQNDPRPWYAVEVVDNMIVNNVAALAGGGMSLQDAVDVRIIHNTIANNDSLATAGEAFAPGSPNQSTPQPGAGIVTRAHSTELSGSGGIGLGTYSAPSELADNIIWQNRQFYFKVLGGVPGDPASVSTWGLCPELVANPADAVLGCGTTEVYSDLGVIGAVGALACDPAGSCLTTGGADPAFVAEYVNGARSSVVQPEITTAIQAPPAFDEGGNFIRPTYGPLSLYNDALANDGIPGSLFGDYHVQGGVSPAIDAGFDLTLAYPILQLDFDSETRPNGAGVDIGADEVHQ